MCRWFESSWYHAQKAHRSVGFLFVSIPCYLRDVAESSTQVFIGSGFSEQDSGTLRSILNNMGDPVFVKDHKSRLVLVNDAFCELFAKPRQEILGKTLAEDVSPDEREHFIKIDREVLESGSESIVEERLTVRGGETKIISTRKTRFIDDEGNRFLVGVIRDVTAIRDVEELSRLNKLNELLLNAAQLLSSPEEDPYNALRTLVKQISLHFGAVCDVSIVNDETGVIEPIGVYHEDPVVKHEIEVIFAQNTLRKGQGMVGSVIESGKEVVFQTVPESVKEGKSAHPKLSPVSVVYVPIKVDSGAIGSLNLTRIAGYEAFSDDEVNQIRKIGQYISVFVQNAVLSSSRNREMEKRIEFEEKLELEKKWAEYKLEITSLLANSDLTTEKALQQMCSSLSGFFNAIVDVQLVDENHETVRLAALAHENSELEKSVRGQLNIMELKVGNGLVGSVLETGTELYLQQLPQEVISAALNNGFPKEILPFSLAYLPLKIEDRVIGTIDFSRLEGEQPISLFELGQMRDLTFYVSRFIENRRLYQKQQDEITLRLKVERDLEKETKKLAQLEREHRDILDAIPIQVSRISKDLRYTFVNAAHRGSHRNTQNLIGRKVEDVLGSEMTEKLKPYLEKALSGEPITFEFGGAMADGKKRYISTALAPYFVDNEVHGIYACSIDLTDKVAAERQAKLTKERFQSLALNSGDAFFFHDVNQNIIDVNEVATDMLGYTREELLSMKASEIDPRWKKDIYLRFLDELELNLPQTFDTVVTAKNGTRIPVEVRFVKRSEHGKIYIQSLLRDRTEKRDQELKLLRSEERLRLIFESIEDHIATIHEDGKIESVNKTAQGVKPEDVIGGSVFDWYPDPDIRTYVEDRFARLVETGEGFEVETNSYEGPDGTICIYRNKYIGKFHDGDSYKVLLIIRDVTSEKNREYSVMNAAIEGQEQERKRLGAELHDGIGQVLTALAFELSRTRQRAENEGLAEVTDALNNIGQNLQTAIKEVRTISHNLMPDVLESFGLKDAIGQMCSSIQEQSGIKVSFESVDLDESYAPEVEKNLYRICQELLNNAQKHAYCNRIFVNLMDHGDVLNLSIEDDGVGFDLKDSSKVGIGLQNVRSRVNLINGKVDMESSENTGTLVNIEIPKAWL